jgi:succinate dehydrogenase flavin-adding protein (antitoxin of CptAB toxin-antitoxin module)
MFSLFGSKTHKMVNRWKKEHEELVVLGKEVLGEYVKGDEEKTRHVLKQFVDKAVDHLNSEDIEMFRLLRDAGVKDENIENLINDFQESFKDTKNTLMKVLAKYVRPDTPLDEEFFDTFSKIMDILAQRIEYEEQNLYLYLSLS